MKIEIHIEKGERSIIISFQDGTKIVVRSSYSHRIIANEDFTIIYIQTYTIHIV
jgi:hypothetical protein